MIQLAEPLNRKKTIKIIDECKPRTPQASEFFSSGFLTVNGGQLSEFISITKLDLKNKKIGIKRLGEGEKIYDLVIQGIQKGSESNDALNKLNAKKPTKRPVENKIQIAARITFQSDPFKSHEEKNFLIINDCKTVEQVAERVKQILIMELDR